jgi:hypothetical protein
VIFTTRFAPSPTGPLHLGHAYSALLAHDMARKASGRFLLRIDDLDQSRARAHWEDQIKDDLHWLGVTWDGPVRRQSDHFDGYRDTLQSLADQGAVYPCSCKRRDIEAAASAQHRARAPRAPGSRASTRYVHSSARRVPLPFAMSRGARPPTPASGSRPPAALAAVCRGRPPRFGPISKTLGIWSPVMAMRPCQIWLKS